MIAEARLWAKESVHTKAGAKGGTVKGGARSARKRVGIASENVPLKKGENEMWRRAEWRYHEPPSLHSAEPVLRPITTR
jgi:hypothetical protein